MPNIQRNILLAPLTTFKIGGPADFYIEATDNNTLIRAVKWAKENSHDFFILGGGSNILVGDQGYRGLVIKNNCRQIVTVKDGIKSQSGASLAKLINLAVENKLSGLEWATGIPGSIGGAISGNAGAYGSSIDKVVERVDVYFLKKGKFGRLANNQCNFSYRHSIFKEEEIIILDSLIKLKRGSQTEIKKLMKKYINQRAKTQPRQPSAGSIFKNITIEQLRQGNQELAGEAESEGVVKCGKVGVGWIIDRLGLRGKAIGGAKISKIHANFIVNIGKAKAEDVDMLIGFIKQKARSELGIQLLEEIKYFL